MQRIVSDITIDLPFQKSKFLVMLAVNSTLCAIGLAALQIDFLATTGVVILATVYFMPTCVAFDLLSSYSNDYKIEKLNHPRRHLILWMNLTLGITIIGWIVTMALAFKPGLTHTQRVDYFE